MTALVTVILSLLGIISLGMVLADSMMSIAIGLDTAKKVLETPMVVNFYNALLPIGLSLLLLYFLLDLMEQTTHDNFTPEHLFKGLLKLCLGVLILSNLMEMMLAFLDFSKLLGKEFDKSYGYSAMLTPIPNLSAASFLTVIGDALSYALNALPLFLMMVALYFTSITRNINIAILAVFSPIGVANVFGKGMDSSGMTYIKRFLALCLQGAIMAGIVGIYLVLVVDMSSYMSAPSGISTGTFNLFSEFIAGFAAISLIFKSRNIANEIVGVR